MVVNNDLYCGKLLYIDKNAVSSYHYHNVKKETFYGLMGQVVLTVDNKDYMLNPFSRPKTINPGQFHMFRGITDGVVMEISTPHKEEDVVRETESEAGWDT